jgi:hypothetical protein
MDDCSAKPIFASVCDTLGPVAREVKSPIKSIYYMVWIFGVLLMIAALDKIPDPPAAKPNHTRISASCLHNQSVAVGMVRVFIDALFHVPAPIAEAYVLELRPYRDRIVLVGRAADSSPPSPKS